MYKVSKIQSSNPKPVLQVTHKPLQVTIEIQACFSQSERFSGVTTPPPPNTRDNINEAVVESIFLVGLKKATEIFSQGSRHPGREWIPGYIEYESGAKTVPNATFILFPFDRHCHVKKLGPSTYSLINEISFGLSAILLVSQRSFTILGHLQNYLRQAYNSLPHFQYALTPIFQASLLKLSS
jgi:hypothetical protein